jgi:ribonuclease HII
LRQIKIAKSKLLIGLDEVGRGCLAGPVVSAAVGFNQTPDGLKDSKRLTKNQRIKLLPIILKNAYFVGIGVVDNRYIDDFGLTKSVSMSMQIALINLDKKNKDYQIVIDGNYNFLKNYNFVKTAIRGDNLINEIMAASIVAKVFRDALMQKIHNDWPQYGFDQHVGYGTEYHLNQLAKYGPCPIHRLSFRPVQASIVV